MVAPKIVPLQLGPGTPVFCSNFRQNFRNMVRLHGATVKFAQLKHVTAFMVNVTYTYRDGRRTEMKLHIYEERLAAEHNNLVCDESRIVGA